MRKNLRYHEIMQTEEELKEFFHRTSLAPKEIRRKLEKLVEYYGDLETVAKRLEVSTDWLDYYIQHLDINPPVSSHKRKGN